MVSRAGVNQNGDAFKSYRDGWEHINDELELLDLRIRLQLQVQKVGQSQDQVRQFKGLLISEEEVEGLLGSM